MEPPPIFKSPQKPPLITPSASPPPVRTFFPQPYRLSDSAPPLKKQRLLSISRQSSVHSSSPATSTPDPPIDLQKEREASALRLLDVWSQLADRYTRRLDEDDIVDLRTGQIVKDNGVIRNSRKLQFGASSDPKNNIENEEAIEDDDVEEGDDDIDELDAFAQANGASDEAELEIEGRRVPPVAPQNPNDAEDLRQFMEAEKLRREACGSEPEDDFESGPPFEDDDGQGDASDSERATADGTEEVEEEESGEEGKEEEEWVEEEDDKPDDPPRDRPERYQYVGDDSSSDDELNNWEVNKSRIVYPTPKKEQAESVAPSDSDSEVEIIEPPVPVKATQTSKHTEGSTRRPHVQLQTPPHSTASEDFSHSNHLVQAPASPPPISSSSTSQPTVFPPKRGRGRPRKPNNAVLNLEQDKSPIPKIDLVQLSKANAQKKKTPLGVSQSEKASGTETAISPQKIPGLVPEVVIIKRRPFSQKVTPSHPASNADGKSDASPSKGGKGKEKEIPPDARKRHYKPTNQPDPLGERLEEDDEPIIIPSSSVGSSKVKTQSATGVSTAKKRHSPVPGRAEYPKKEIGTPVPTDMRSGSCGPLGPGSSPRKRKRVVSLSESDVPQGETFQSMGSLKAVKSEPSRQHRERPFHHKSVSRSGSCDAEVKRKDIQNSPQKRRSKSTSRRSPSASGSNSESECSDASTPSRTVRRSKSHLSTLPSHFYPYPSSLYPPPHPHIQPQNMFAPMPDPRAQFIITQAMHQLSALVSGPWPAHPQNGAAPYTPSRHRDQGHQAMYATPTHHPHPYTYAYDPEFSRATLPPDTPETVSSPDERRDSDRRKSLVGRSRSRGRRVSFKIEGEDIDLDPMDIYSSPMGNHANRGTTSERGHSSESDEPSPSKPKAQGKVKEGKPRMRTPGSKSKPGCEDVEKDGSARGVPFDRGQTPGPSTRNESHYSTDEPSSFKGASTAERGRSRSRSVFTGV